MANGTIAVVALAATSVSGGTSGAAGGEIIIWLITESAGPYASAGIATIRTDTRIFGYKVNKLSIEGYQENGHEKNK